MSVLIATVMFIITMLFFVAFLRLAARRRHNRPKGSPGAQEAEEKPENEPEKVGRWGVPKGSYCYPGINDTMGYEFVKVVPVDEDIRPKGVITKAPAETDDEDGMHVSTVGENVAPRQEETGNVIHAVPDQAEQEEDPAAKRFDDGSDSTLDIDAADWGQLNAAWQSREHDEPAYDEEINRILDENPDFISDEEPTDEDLEIERQINALDSNYAMMRQALTQSLDSDPSQETSKILERLSELDRANTEGMPSVTTDDLPDID